MALKQHPLQKILSHLHTVGCAGSSIADRIEFFGKSLLGRVYCLLSKRFIVKHLLDFKFYEKSTTTLHGVETYDVYAMVLSRFQGDPVHLIFYVLFMVAVGLHLSHALQSALQTYGVYVPREGSKIKKVSALVGYGMAATFAIIPIMAFIK